MNTAQMLEVQSRPDLTQGLFGVFYVSTPNNTPVIVTDEDTQLCGPAIFFMREQAEQYLDFWNKDLDGDPIEIRSLSLTFQGSPAQGA